MYTEAEKQKTGIRTWPVKQLFSRPGAVAMLAVLEQPAESRSGTVKQKNAGIAHNSIRTRLKSIFWCWQYKLSWKAENGLKRRKTALKRKAEKAEDGKRRKAGSEKQKSRKRRKAGNNPRTGAHKQEMQLIGKRRQHGKSRKSRKSRKTGNQKQKNRP